MEITDEEMITLLNKNLKPFKVNNDIEKRLEVFVLMGAFTQGRAVSIDLGTLGVKVDSTITNRIVQTMKSDYSEFLLKQNKNMDHEFSYIFNFDFDRNQVSNYMKVRTAPLRKNWRLYFKITN